MQKSLAQMKPGQKAVVVGFTDQQIALKLLEMGVLPGIELTVKHIAPMGDPMAIDLDNYLLALRKDEAATILVI